MILVDGFFQADPHPGNVLYLPGNRIALIDFGMVGRLSPVRRNQVVELLAGLARHDESAMLEVLLDWRGDDAVDEPQLAADLSERLRLRGCGAEGSPDRDAAAPRFGDLARARDRAAG